MLLVYNYMLDSYPVKREVLYPAHKRSELKKVYNNIVNMSKRSPLYKINLSKENQEYTIGIKETALYLKGKLEEMSAAEEKIGFHSKAVRVSDEAVLSAKLLTEEVEELPDTMIFQVNRLASVQRNLGKELYDDSRGLAPGAYQFTVKTMEDTHHLTFVLEERKENRDVIKSMVNYINQSVPGIKASVERGASNYSRIVLQSEQAGRNGELAMTFSDDDYDGVVDYFGMDRVESSPNQAEFSINDISHTTRTNTFHLDDKLSITLDHASEKPVTVKIGPDSKKILSAVESVLDTYNSLVRIAQNRTSGMREHYRANKLISEMKGLEKLYGEELEASGIKADENGFLSLEDSLAVQSAEDGGMESLFTRENGFIAKLIDKAESIAINPMEYLDKTIVTYPNKDNKTFRNPYVTSVYSGLFFSSYC